MGFREDETVEIPPARWIEIDARGEPHDGAPMETGIYLVKVMRGLRVKSTFDVVLHLTRRGWRRPSGSVYEPQGEVPQRCQRIGSLPVDAG